MKELISLFGYLGWLTIRILTAFIVTAIFASTLGTILYKMELVFLSQLLMIPTILSLFTYAYFFRKLDSKKGMGWQLFETKECIENKNNIIKF